MAPATLSAKALRFCETHGTPPTPEAYAVWYAFASGQPESIRRKIQQQIDDDSGLSPFEIDQIYQEFLALSELQRREQELAGFKLDREMGKAAGLVQRQIGTNERFAHVLKKSANVMAATVNQDAMRDALDELLLENGRMRAESVKLNQHLTQIRVEVRKLNAKLEESRQNEFRDPLTEIANRRCLDRVLKMRLAEAHSNGTPLCLVMADLDHFKLINDNFGHVVGDELLRFFAKTLTTNIKGRDTAARYGGEEFALVLPSTNLTNATNLVRQIMTELDKANLIITTDKRRLGKITSSFGIAQLRSDDDPESLVKRADANLYQAKNSGRNRAVGDSPAESESGLPPEKWSSLK